MNQHDRGPIYPETEFSEPAPYGYVYLGFRVDPPKRLPFVRPSAERSRAVRECKQRASRLAELDAVVSATVYEAALIPPVSGSPRFDVLILVETTSPETIAEVETADAYLALKPDFVMAATNARRIGDVDRDRSGHFLFNHFTAPEPRKALATFEVITRWFVSEARVTDSALLTPTRESPYVFVNHVRLPTGPIGFMLNFAKPSFRRFVGAKLKAGGIGTAPIIYRSR